jgi:salicylate hydroxylase
MRDAAVALTGLDLAVVGAGIGGLAAALALRRAGARVQVLEQAGQIAEVGAGLQISANGMAVLRALGVVDAAAGAGLKSGGTIIRDYRSGRRITEMPPPSAGPTFYFHRADLIDLLHGAARTAGVDILLGRTVAACRSEGGRQLIETAEGQVFRPDLVIAADGGRSLLRTGLSGPESPAFTGQVAWRAVVDGPFPDLPRKAVLTMAPGRHVVTYPLRGGRQVNIAAFEERTDWREEGWRHAGDPEEFRQRFSAFGGDIAPLLARVETVHLWALFLRPVAARWQNGHLALLGDAAHPTLPYMAQGACLALEDAWVLARSLAQDNDTAQALARYEAARKDRARRVVAAAAANARNFHYKSPMREIAQLGLSVLGPRMARRYDWIYDCDVTR